MDSSAMGRLLGAAAKADGRGQGRDKDETWCFSQPHRERGLQRDGQSQGTLSCGQWEPAMVAGRGTPRSIGAAGSGLRAPQAGGNPSPMAGVTPGNSTCLCLNEPQPWG